MLILLPNNEIETHVQENRFIGNVVVVKWSIL